MAALGAVVGLLALVGWALWLADGPSPTPDERTTAIAEALACPSCEGQSVAHSESPVARQMRLVVAEQVAQGRSDAEIRQWFADRYGDDVLLSPPLRGSGAVLWAVPVLVLAGGLALVRRSRAPTKAPAVPRPGRRRLAVVAAVPVVVGLVAWTVVTGARPSGDAAAGQAAAGEPAGGTAALLAGQAADLERRGDDSGALEAYRAAYRAAPEDSSVGVRLAFLLLKTGHVQEAEDLAKGLQADSVDAVLLLGMAQRSRGEPEARATLERFLALAPSHPAAAQVRQLLSEGS